MSRWRRLVDFAYCYAGALTYVGGYAAVKALNNDPFEAVGDSLFLTFAVALGVLGNTLHAGRRARRMFEQLADHPHLLECGVCGDRLEVPNRAAVRPAIQHHVEFMCPGPRSERTKEA